MNFREFLKENIVLFDGGMGTLLQQRGLKAGQLPERMNITERDVITEIHTAYFDAGSNVVTANTFGASSLKFSDDELEEIIKAAIENVKEAAQKSVSYAEKFVALDIGPLGRLLKPLGDLDFEEAVKIFAKTVTLGEKYGADLIIIETMNDSYETKAAVLAAKENSNLPIVVTNAYGEDKKLMTGASPATMAVMLSSLDVDMIGANCSLGPKELYDVIRDLLKYSKKPVVFQPNAGLPMVKDGQTVFNITAKEFASSVCDLVDKGVRGVGGCCGTTPEYIAELRKGIIDKKPKPVLKKNYTAVTSYTNTVFFGDSPLLIGERINPTGKKRFKEALKNDWVGYEELRLKALNCPLKFGNDNEEADRYAFGMSSWYANYVTGRPNGRGGFYKADMHSALQFVIQGKKTEATPDGRKMGDEYSKNVSPVIGMDRNGATALINSIAAIEPYRYSVSCALDMMLHPSAVAGESGLAAMKTLLDTFMEKGGLSIQFNIFDAETLKDAQKHPEKYRSLQVRISGWNALWNSLSKEEQDAYILRAENIK